MQQELQHARSASDWIERRRFVPAQWRDVDGWELYAPQGDTWFGFDSVRAVLGAEEEDILLVPLSGHTLGHAGIALRTADGWQLHAGDAYFHHDEIHQPKRRCPPGMRLYQCMMDSDRHARLHNQQRLRELAADARAAVKIYCSHDARELEQAMHAGADAAARLPGQGDRLRHL
uniref:hypothetical protein n=1 Tax=unclassified Pseudomonas TaxID=196821 RepID=UPI003158154E